MTTYLLDLARRMSPFRTPTEAPDDAANPDRAQTATPQELHHESSFDDDPDFSKLRKTLQLITEQELALLTEARRMTKLRTAATLRLAQAESSSQAAENPVDYSTVDPALQRPSSVPDSNEDPERIFRSVNRSKISAERHSATDGIDRSPRPSPIEHRDEMTPLRGRTLSDRFHEHSSPTSTYSRGAFTLDKSERSRLLAGASQGRGNFSEFDTPMRVGEKAFSKLLAEGSKKLKLPWLYDGKSTQMIVFNKEITDRADIQRFSKILTITKDGEAYDLLQDWTLLTVDDVELHQAELIAVHDADPTWMNQRPLIDMSMMYSMLKSSLSALMLARMAPYEQDIARNGPLLFRHVMAASHLESFDQMSTQVFAFLQPKSLKSYHHDIQRFHVKFNEEHDKLILLSKDKKDLLSPSLMRHMLLQTYKTCQCDYFVRNSLPDIERYIHNKHPAILPLQIHVEKEVARLVLTNHWHVPGFAPPNQAGRHRNRHGLNLTCVDDDETTTDEAQPLTKSQKKAAAKKRAAAKRQAEDQKQAEEQRQIEAHEDQTAEDIQRFHDDKKHEAGYKKLEQARALLAFYDPNMDDDLPIQLLQLLKE